MWLIGIGRHVMAISLGRFMMGLAVAGLGSFGFLAGRHGNFLCLSELKSFGKPERKRRQGTMFPRGETSMAARKKTARKTARSKVKTAAKKAGKGVAAVAKKALKKYQSMRDFTVTAEPSGRRPVATAARLRYVIQKHEATR